MARHPLRIAYGPVVGIYLSAVRLACAIVDATMWIIDRGMRWRWRAVALKHPSLSVFANGEGAVMEAIWKLLRSYAATADWNGDFRAALRSAISDRQWTQY